jgi:hypothetical protein
MHCRWWQRSFNLGSVEETSTAPKLVSIRWILYRSWRWVPFCPLKTAFVQSKTPLSGLKMPSTPIVFGGSSFKFQYFYSTSGFSLSSRGRKIIASRQPIAPHVCDLSCNMHSIGIQHSQLKTRVCHSGIDSVMCCIFQRHATQRKIHASTNKNISRIFHSSKLGWRNAAFF